MQTYIFFYIIQAPIVGYECSNLFPVLDELDPGTFSNGRIGLLSLNTSEIRLPLLI